MKRFSFSLIFVALAFFLSRASGGGLSDKSFWGVRLSYELAAPGDVNLKNGYKMDLYGNGSGFSAGAVYHIPVFYNFYFEPGAQFYYNTYSLNRTLVDDSLDDDAGSVVKSTGASARMWGVRIPVIGGYRFDLFPGFDISVFTGPEFNLGLSAKNHVSVGSFSASSSAYGDDGTLNRADIKWRFGVGVTFCSHVYGAVSGAIGMCDMSRGRSTMHSNLFDITLGYNF
ncbi:MAG: hypothetical protein K2G01_04900 [Paramuribaculum sp.]|nr:hypothetical protein [Paramuribaculum sp.]